MNRRHLINFGGVLSAAGTWLRTRPILPAALAAVARSRAVRTASQFGAVCPTSTDAPRWQRCGH